METVSVTPVENGAMEAVGGGAGGGARRHRLVVAACRCLHEAEGPVPLGTLARAAGMSASRFQRLFRSVLGVTPRQYASALQRERAQAALGRLPRVTDAVFEAGFASPSRFYERTREMLGMTPSAWRAGGAGVAIAHAVVDTRLGPLLVAATAEGVCRVVFGEADDVGAVHGGGEDDGDGGPEALVAALAARFPNATLEPGDARFRATVETVAALVAESAAARRAALALPLDIDGTLFQCQVWRVLRGIPAGRTMSYAEVAAAVGRPDAHRAVANACGANPVALLIPCHRATRRGGALGGYRWGLARKRALLEGEGARTTPPPLRRSATNLRSRPCTGT